MGTSLDAFVKTVLGYTFSSSWRELAELNRKALNDVLERNLIHLDTVLETLTADRYSMSVVTILYVKMNQPYTESTKDRFELTLSQIELMLPFFDSVQISMIPDIYVSLFRKVYEHCLLQVYKPALGIRLLTNAINLLVKEEKGVVTSLHSCLFCLCLKARIYSPALPFMNPTVSKIFKENTNQSAPYMDSKWVLLYFYYGGLIHAVMGQYEEAFEMMQKTCSVPAVAPSAIMVQAYKKYVLLSLLLHGKLPLSSNFRSPMIARSIIPMCSDYTALEKLCDTEVENSDKAGAVLKYLDTHRTVFEKDKTVGLVKLLVRRIRENSVKKLTECFISLSLTDITRRCYLDNCNHAESYLRQMCTEGKIRVRIDDKQGLVYFDEMEEKASEQKVDEAANRIYMLDALMKQFDNRIRVNPSYITRTVRPVATRGANVPPDEGLGYPGTAFMPNINVAIESAASRAMDMRD